MILKAELHCHLEGAAPPDLVRTLAARYGATLGPIFKTDGSYAWHDFTSFLAAYDAASRVFRTPEDYALLTERYLAASAAEGCIYTEVFASPDHARDAGLPYADYVAGIAEGMARAETAYGIVGRIIAICVRHYGPERAEATARLVAAHPHPRVTGFGMAGEERTYRPADFARAFAIARDAGLALTCHAGELAGAEMVAATLDAIPRVERIGHGVRAIEDARVVRRLAETGIVLEVCPGSNLALGLFASWAEHPVEALRRAGVRVALGSDDPPFFHTTIGAEYEGVARAFGLDDAAMASVTRTALEAAFCDAPTRAALLARLDAASP